MSTFWDFSFVLEATTILADSTLAADGTRETEANGATPSYVEEGTGEPVVFIHGGLADLRTWAALMRCAALALGLLLALASPATAGPFDDAQAAYELNDYVTALLLLKPLADEGHVEAQKLLGYMHEIGQGVPQEYFYAVTWYEKAAANGDGDARVRLANVTARRQAFKAAEDAHEIGDNATALTLLRPLADQGYAQAQKLLGYMYELGHGVPQDYFQAADWYRKASAKGVGYARARLNNLTARGVLVPN